MQTRLSLIQSRQNSLSEKNDTVFIYNTFLKVKKENLRVLAWFTKTHEKRELTELVLRTIRKSKSELEFTLQNITNSKFALELSQNHLINIFVPDAGLMANCLIKLKSEHEITVTIPKKVAVVERRKYLRLLLGESCAVQTIFYKTVHTSVEKTVLVDKPVYDLSAGGFSLMISFEEAQFFKTGDEVIGLSLLGHEWRIDVNAVVKAIIEVSPEKTKSLNYRAWKICLEFKNLFKTDKNIIEDFVISHIEL